MSTKQPASKAAKRKKPFRVVLGKYYKTRDGQVVGPTVSSKGKSSYYPEFPYWIEDIKIGLSGSMKSSYAKDGSAGFGKQAQDLIREVTPKGKARKP
jgi:hypothetical protein